MGAQLRSIPGGKQGGTPPIDPDVERRLTALETRLDAALPTLATKSDIEGVRADLHKVSSDFRGWTLQTVLAIIGTMLAGFFGAANLLSKSPPSNPSPTVQPIVIHTQGAAPLPASPTSGKKP